MASSSEPKLSWLPLHIIADVTRVQHLLQFTFFVLPSVSKWYAVTLMPWAVGRPTANAAGPSTMSLKNQTMWLNSFIRRIHVVGVSMQERRRFMGALLNRLVRLRNWLGPDLFEGPLEFSSPRWNRAFLEDAPFLEAAEAGCFHRLQRLAHVRLLDSGGAILGTLGAFPRLHTLELPGTSIARRTIAALGRPSSCPSLTHLDFSECESIGTNFALLKGRFGSGSSCVPFRVLLLDDCSDSITSNSVQPILAISDKGASLVHLGLRSCHMGSMLTSLTFSDIQVLDLAGAKMRGDSLSSTFTPARASEFRNLRELAISNEVDPLLAFLAGGHAPALESLTLAAAEASESVFIRYAESGGTPRLRVLKLQRVSGLTAKSVAAVGSGRLGVLEELRVLGMTLPAALLAPVVRNCKQLRRLLVPNSAGFSDALMKLIVRTSHCQRRLAEIDVSECQRVTAESVAMLSSLSGLRVLNVTHCRGVTRESLDRAVNGRVSVRIIW